LLSSLTDDSYWSIPLKLMDGRTLYVLSLEVRSNYAKANQVEGLELVLSCPHQREDAQNLLAPIRNWHGAQPFLFDAWDLAAGPELSTYGANRTILVKNLGLSVHIHVVSAKVRVGPTSGVGDYQLTALELRISVDNVSREQ